MKRKICVVLALLIALSVLLQGCYTASDPSPFSWKDFAQNVNPTEPTAPTADPTEPSSDPVAPADWTERDEPLLALVDFAEMEYVRPDIDALCKGFADVQAMVEGGSSAEDVLAALYPVYGDYLRFETMGTIANIRYTLDLNDTFYDEENQWCEEQSPVVEQALEKCYIAMAGSPIRNELEELEFGEGFFLYYDENEVYSNDRVVELMQQESDLQTQYMALQSDMTITWKGEERLVEELLEEDLPYAEILEVYRLYYAKYNPQAAELFIQLIGVRKQIAEELGYDSYADFAYSFYYDRDYTPEQVKQYNADVAKELAAYYYDAVYSGYDKAITMNQVMELLKQTADTLGGEFAAAYGFMEKYNLFDVTKSTSKMPGSYVTYLTAYEAPFLYVSPTDDIDDFLTATHEFGHFVDGYVNCNGTSSIDCNEIFSQGLEYLSLSRANLNKTDRAGLTESKIGDAIATFLTQSCYAEFELRVYALPEEELTVEKLNEIFLECNEEFGMGMYGLESIIGPGWIDIQHFFIAPFYVISYCISNDAALQIYQAELENGNGLDVYRKLMSLSSGNTILALLEEAGLESPFKPGRMAELADFFEEQLYG
ncbi:MAG: hypothetical protein IJJ99_02065 [Oscillospiraceae bacterium]|nr:hypothetical protein [Oscillospiraceae bacterium]